MLNQPISRRTLVSGALAAAVNAAEAYRLIDPHVHVWKVDPNYPWAKETRNPPTEDRSPEMLIELMKKNGVEKTVIIQVIHYRWDNSFLADTLKKYPQYFQGVARVNPEDPAAPDTLSSLVKQGFKGVRISPAANATGDWIRGPLMPPLWKRCSDLKSVMTVLCPVARIPDVEKLVEKHPDMTVVIDHMADSPIGQPQELEKLLALRRYPKVFVKISHTWSLSKQPYPWKDTWEQVKRLHQGFGPQRLMWGTDWPVCLGHATYEQTLGVVRDEMDFLNDDDKSWILSKSIERVWPFPK